MEATIDERARPEHIRRRRTCAAGVDWRTATDCADQSIHPSGCISIRASNHADSVAGTVGAGTTATRRTRRQRRRRGGKRPESAARPSVNVQKHTATRVR
jgi:hypothetical protein